MCSEYSGDILGERGRGALDLCVKVSLEIKVSEKARQRFDMFGVKNDFIVQLQCDTFGKTELSRCNERNGFVALCNPRKKVEQLLDKVGVEDGYNEREKPQAVQRTCSCVMGKQQPVFEPTALKHGSGIILNDHFVVTSKQVVESAFNDRAEGYVVYISNAAIGKLPCQVFDVDELNDLALLRCHDLNLEKNRLLPLSNQLLSPDLPIICFGYPLSYRGERALVVNGKVCPSEPISGDSTIPLECPLNSGNYGSPVLRWINDQLRVVGVVTRKNVLEVDTLVKRDGIQNAPQSNHTRETAHMMTSDTATQQLVRHVLHNIVKARSPFSVLPGICLVEFVKTSARKHGGKHKEELDEIIKRCKILE